MKKMPVSKKKMRGVIDPLTLGFLIVLIGGGVMHKVYNKDTAEAKQAQVANKAVVVDSNEKEDY